MSQRFRKSLPAASSKQSLVHTVRNNRQDRTLSLQSSGINFTEATGKTIALIHYQNDSPDWQALEVRFTDGTRFCFELIPQVLLRAEYMEQRDGDLHPIRSYGTSLYKKGNVEEGWRKGEEER